MRGPVIIHLAPADIVEGWAAFCPNPECDEWLEWTVGIDDPYINECPACHKRWAMKVSPEDGRFSAEPAREHHCEWWLENRTQCYRTVTALVPCYGYDWPHYVCERHEQDALAHCQWGQRNHGFVVEVDDDREAEPYRIGYSGTKRTWFVYDCRTEARPKVAGPFATREEALADATRRNVGRQR